MELREMVSKKQVQVRYPAPPPIPWNRSSYRIPYVGLCGDIGRDIDLGTVTLELLPCSGLFDGAVWRFES